MIRRTIRSSQTTENPTTRASKATENPTARASKVTSQGAGSQRILGDVTNVNRNSSRALDGKPVPRKALPKQKASSSQLPREVESSKSIKDEIDDEVKMELEVVDEVNLASDMLDRLDVEDVDLVDSWNPLLCTEYVKDIYAYLNELETHLQVGDYFGNQTEVTTKMRSILVDWLIQVQMRFNLLQETLYLTIHILDRFLATSNVGKKELQLVGVTAMFLASKYEEMYAPEIGDFVYITDNAYTKTRIRTMEQTMLKALDFDLSNPLCLHFLRRNSKVGEANAQKHTLAKYLMEITLIDFKLATKKPSQIAAAALCLAFKIIDQSEWTPALQHYSGYSEEALASTMKGMAHLLIAMESKGNKFEAAKNKYAASKFMKISRIPELKSEFVQQLASS